MRDEEVLFDRRCHVLYSPKCKEEILKKIRLHYSSEKADEIFEKIQIQYSDYLRNYRTDLGGKANFHNGVAGTYDCIALFAYYTVCREKTSVDEIEEMNDHLFLPAFKKLGFVDCNREIYKRLMYMSFKIAEKKCRKWNDYTMKVSPYQKGEPIRYEFTTCPIAEFAKEYDLLDILPAFCNGEYKAMELIHARLVRRTTCGNGSVCDYAIYGDKDKRLQKYAEYVDTEGYRTNKR